MTDQYSILFKQEQAHDDAIWSVAWGTNKKENSETVVTGSLDDLVKVWKWCDERLDLERSLEGHQCLWTSATRCPSLRPDHQYFDIATGKLLHTLGGHAMPIRSLIFSPDSQLLVTASDDSYIKIYDVQHANLDGTLNGHASWVLNVAFCPDDTHFVSSSSDKSVKVWDVGTRTCGGEHPGLESGLKPRGHPGGRGILKGI
uniref:Superkiller complex protein 8 n=1 Tax=Canis lupus dingo TaxID=286419 RepID=A0A8C0L1Z1_CANLU